MLNRSCANSSTSSDSSTVSIFLQRARILESRSNLIGDTARFQIVPAKPAFWGSTCQSRQRKMSCKERSGLLRIRRDEGANDRRISPISPASSKRNRSCGRLSPQTCLPGLCRSHPSYPPYPPFLPYPPYPPFLPFLPLISTSTESGRPLTKSM